MYAIDLFCGAGGFSEGIIQAGFHIVFSNDRSAHVMDTYISRHEQLGLNQDQNTHFELADVRDLTGNHIFNCINHLEFFKDKPLSDIDVIFGGPPCQGFSRAGRRNPDDPRNMLFREYVRIIDEVKPKYVVMENVEGFMDTKLNKFQGLKDKTYPDDTLVSDILQQELNLIGYNVLEPKILDASNYGVPQRRNRAIFMAYRQDVIAPDYPEPTTLHSNQKVTVSKAIGDLVTNSKIIETIENKSSDYVNESTNGRTPHFQNGKPIIRTGIKNHDFASHSKSVQERFSLYRDGENTRNVKNRILVEGLDFINYPNLLWECLFNSNKICNKNNLNKLLSLFNEKYISLKESEREKVANSTLKLLSKLLIIESIEMNNEEAIKKANIIKTRIIRSLNFSKESFEKFYDCWIQSVNMKYNFETIKEQFLTSQVDEQLFEYLLTKKNSRIRLNRNSISPTMLTLPDDFISPFENRILTVREMARLQSFDDSFEFLGKRTTGGQLRKEDVPQYTQVGNAVPPLLARAIAIEIKYALENMKEELVK